jgi:hypothetical protein
VSTTIQAFKTELAIGGIAALVVVALLGRFRSASGLSRDTVRTVSVAGMVLSLAAGIWIPLQADWAVEVPWDRPG